LNAVLAAVAVAWLALATGWIVASRVPQRRTLRALWLWAVLMRLAGFLGEPLLEDDWARYLWDGREFALTGNPYSSTPSAHFANKDVPEKFARLLDQINNPDLPTIYGPLCQIAFLASYIIAPGELWPLKLLLLAADLATLGLLLRHTIPRHALLYAWCPLLLQETAFTAHPESLWIVCMVAALHFTARRKALPAAIFCGIACAAKVIALLIVPFILLRMARRYWAIAVVSGASCYAWFWLRGSGADLPALRAMTANWEFNSFVFAVISSITGHSTAIPIAAALYAMIWVALFAHDRMRRPEFPRGDLVYGCFFLCSAVVNPWYLLAILPFVSIYPTLWGATALAIVPLSYAHGLHLSGAVGLAPFELPLAIRLLEGGALLLAVAGDFVLRRHTAKRESVGTN
jgi:alpha-1,6-mannosyltransferase